jgi:pimeloyl-ACP methyl ester carboxylesterase
MRHLLADSYRRSTQDDEEAAMTIELEVKAHGRRLAGDDARERLLARMPVTERHLRLAGVSTAVLSGGDGRPVVLLHGPGEFAAKWMRVIPDLVTTNFVVAPDLPGHGTSDVVGGALDADHVVEWLAELIERTCATPPALVGHLLGGAMAARFAVRHSDRLSRLVLVDALGLGPFRPSPRFALALARFLAHPTERADDRLWRRCTVDLDGVRAQMGESWETFAAYHLDRARTRSGKAPLRTLMRKVGVPAIASHDLARITVPTTLIWGRHDMAPRLRTAEAASIRHGWPLHVIENAANDPVIEAPEAFLAALRAALANS